MECENPVFELSAHSVFVMVIVSLFLWLCSVLLSGGLQQYLIRQSVNEQPRKGAGSDVTTFHDLPVSHLDCLLISLILFVS